MPLTFNITDDDRIRFKNEFDRLFSPYDEQIVYPQSSIWIAVQKLVALAGDIPPIPADGRLQMTCKSMPSASEPNWFPFKIEYESCVGFRSTAVRLELRVSGGAGAIQLITSLKLNRQSIDKPIGDGLDLVPEVVRYDAGSRSRHLSASPMGAIDIEPSGIQLENLRMEIDRVDLDRRLGNLDRLVSPDEQLEQANVFNRLRDRYQSAILNIYRVPSTDLVERQSREQSNRDAFVQAFDFAPPEFLATPQAQELLERGEQILRQIYDREEMAMRGFLADQASRLKGSIPIACQGCQNYHGKSHGGNMLVCAIHPSGVGEETSCADFETAEVASESASL